MILDHLGCASFYYPLGERFALVLKALAAEKWTEKTPGRYELFGQDVFVLVSEYEPKPRSAGRWEAHRRYIDVQYVAEGTEQIGVARAEGMNVTQPYDPEKDIVFLEGREGAGNFVTLQGGDFLILYPHEAHMPGLSCGAGHTSRVRKVVAKMRA